MPRTSCARQSKIARLGCVARIAALALLVPALALAQPLYRWTDDKGRVQYSDTPPKNFKGEVTRLEPDTEKAIQPAPTPKAQAPRAAPVEKAERKPEAKDINTRRRENRERLEANLAKARTNLEAARKARDEFPAPEPDERQVVQQQAKAGQGGMHGLSKQRSNCRPVVGKDGKAGTMCPAMVPNDAYFERTGRQDDAVRVAEEELATAEEAWRRGVD